MCLAALSLACLLRTQTKTSPQPPVVSKLFTQLRTLFLHTPSPVQPRLVSTPTSESRPGQVTAFTWATCWYELVSPFQHQQLMFLPRSHRSSCSLAGQTCCQTKHTYAVIRMSQCAVVLQSVSGNKRSCIYGWQAVTYRQRFCGVVYSDSAASTELDWGQ